jgi:hypothetical protein
MHMSNRFFARAVIAGLLGLVGISLGCDRAPGPTSPAALSVPVAITAISPAAGLTGDFVSIAGTGFLPGVVVTLDGVPATINGLASKGTEIVVTTPLHAAGTVDVVVTNAGGQSATLTGGYTFELISITASPSIVAPGGQLTMSWVAPKGRGCSGGGDWIAIYRVGDPDVTGAANGHSDLWYEHLCGAVTGTFALSAPTAPGQYEFRYMVGATAVARSAPVTIGSF